MDGLGRWVADLLRAATLCMFPVLCTAVFAGLIFCDQGRDVLLGLLEFASREEHGHSVSGLIFLGVGAATLGGSVWYSMRWLLGVTMRGLAWSAPPGWGHRWAPRLAGVLPLLLAAGALVLAREGTDVPVAGWAATFVEAAAVLLGLFVWRGHWLQALEAGQWIAPSGARQGGRPSRMAVGAQVPRLTQGVVAWSLFASAVIGVLFWRFPMSLPRVVGTAAVAGFALASINLFGSFVLTFWPLRHRLPPLALVALGWSLLCALFNDNHQVALSTAQAPALPVVSAAQRPLEADFAAFLKPLQTADVAAPRVYFVASEGGGIRAAYWTAAVLDVLRAQSPDFRSHLYALSGVSGGSLGVAAWLMAHRGDYCPGLAAEPVRGLAFAPRSAAEALGSDFLAPAVTGMLYADLAQRFWPAPVASLDRSRAMEGGWQRAFSHLPGQPFEQTMDQLYATCAALPRLLLNATAVETGQRAVLSPLTLADTADSCAVDPLYANALPMMNATQATRQQPLAGLVHHSARFPAVSPAGRVDRAPQPGCPDGARLVDGGYFDNSGTQSVLDLLDRLQRATRDRRLPAFEPVVILVRNSAEPAFAQAVTPADSPSRIAPEAGSILRALFNARASHAVLARAELCRTGVKVVDLVVPEHSAAERAPLGWALSDTVRGHLLAAARQVNLSGTQCASAALPQAGGQP